MQPAEDNTAGKGSYILRKRIWRMSEDKFDNRRPQIAFSEERITRVADPDQKAAGTFSFHSTSDIPIRGIVYSSNPYVALVHPQFDGVDATIHYEVRGQHFREGDELSGYFTIVCNQRECRLPFLIQFHRSPLVSSIGEIASLTDFASLAQGHWAEARTLFYSQAFADFIEAKTPEAHSLYLAYRKAMPTDANFEEFLVAAGLKEPVEFTIRERKETFSHVTENRKETLVIAKNTWGYISIDVKSDNPFVTVEKETVTSDYFLGGTMLLNYYIHRNRMHAGFNRCRLTFTHKGTVRTIEITATSSGEDEMRDLELRRDKQCIYRLFDTYRRYRFREIVTGQWCEESVALLDELMERHPQELWYPLMKAQCLIINKQRQEALWIISEMKRDIIDKSSERWAYLLYLCTLIEQEKSYVDRLTKEIEGIFRKHPESVCIFWFLSFLREGYTNDPARRLHDILQWIGTGHATPLLYIEALSLYEQDPYLLRDFTPVVMNVFYWAAQHTTFSRDLAMQIFHALPYVKGYDAHLIFVVQRAYESFEDKDAYREIVAYLLKNQKYEEKYLMWYRDAIALDLRLSGLYEAYMLSLPDHSTEKIPQMVLMYFRYSCNLPDAKKALLYANLINDRQEVPQLYEQYLRTMESFAIEQMRAGHMNDNLAILYQNILEMGVVDEALARLASGVLYTKKLICHYGNLRRVFLYQEQYEMPIVVPIADHQAYLPILPGAYFLLLETEDGTLLGDAKNYTIQRLLYPECYMQRLRQLAPQALSYILADYSERSEAADYDTTDLIRIPVVLESSVVSGRYKAAKYQEFISFLQDHCREDLLEAHFLSGIDYTLLERRTRDHILGLFLTNERYEPAHEIVQAYDSLEADERMLLRLCEHCIAEQDSVDEFIDALCLYLFEKGFSSSETIAYLANHIVGPSATMIRLWEAAKPLGLSLTELEENILFQTLYTETDLTATATIFDSYLTRGKDRMLIEAYLNASAHAYMLGTSEVSDQLFTYFAYFFDKGSELKESCRLAYMKYLSGLPLLSDREYDVLDYLMQQAISRGQYFAFYKNVDRRLVIKYHLYDKCFVEYRGNPGERIVIAYTYDDGEAREEEMSEMYEGIFVKQFVLFFGETIHYSLYADAVSDLPVASDDLTITSDLSDGELDRYDLLNAMQNAYIYREDSQLSHRMKQYQGLDYVTKQLFTTL